MWKTCAEICELVGLYLLKVLKSIMNEEKIEIYRDDKLVAVYKKTSRTEIDKLRKIEYKKV